MMLKNTLKRRLITMEKLYFYHLNILTYKLNVDEYEIEKVKALEYGCYLTISRNNRRRRVYKAFDLAKLEVERSGIHVSGYTNRSDALEEFKKIATTYVIEFRENSKRKYEETLNQLLKTIDSCDKSLELLK